MVSGQLTIRNRVKRITGQLNTGTGIGVSALIGHLSVPSAA